MPLIIDPNAPNELNRVREANSRLYQTLKEQCPKGVGFLLITFEDPMSLRRPQVALATEHDAATVERLCLGIVQSIRSGNGRGLVGPG